MRYVVFSLLKKDFRLMLASKFFLLALGSLILYSCYINLVYVRLDQETYPVYLYEPHGGSEHCLLCSYKIRECRANASGLFRRLFCRD